MLAQWVAESRETVTYYFYHSISYARRKVNGDGRAVHYTDYAGWGAPSGIGCSLGRISPARRFLDARDGGRSTRRYTSGSFRVNTHERVYARETGRDNICRDLYPCPPALTGRPLFSYRNTVARDEAAYP